MTTLPEALRLADALTENHPYPLDIKQAAAELRRQHGEIKSMQAERMNAERRLFAVEAQRDALLEALKSTGLFLHHCWCDVQMNDHSFVKLNQQMIVVDAAIKAVEGEKT